MRTPGISWRQLPPHGDRKGRRVPVESYWANGGSQNTFTLGPSPRLSDRGRSSLGLRCDPGRSKAHRGGGLANESSSRHVGSPWSTVPRRALRTRGREPLRSQPRLVPVVVRGGPDGARPRWLTLSGSVHEENRGPDGQKNGCAHRDHEERDRARASSSVLALLCLEFASPRFLRRHQTPAWYEGACSRPPLESNLQPGTGVWQAAGRWRSRIEDQHTRWALLSGSATIRSTRILCIHSDPSTARPSRPTSG